MDRRVGIEDRVAQHCSQRLGAKSPLAEPDRMWSAIALDGV